MTVLLGCSSLARLSSGLLLAADTLELRSADSNVTLHPGYSAGSSQPALEAFANGDVNVRGDLTVIGNVGAPGASVSTLTLGGVDVRTDLDSRALAVDLLVKANSSDVYLRSELYTQTETDNLLGAKANSLDVYTRTELDGFLALKANSSDTYTRAVLYQKSEVDSRLAAKQDTLTFYDDVGNFEYGLLKPSSSTVRALAPGSNTSVTPSASGDALYVDVAPTLNVSTVTTSGGITCNGGSLTVDNPTGLYSSLYLTSPSDTAQLFVGSNAGLNVMTATADPIVFRANYTANAAHTLTLNANNSAVFASTVTGVSFTSTSDASIKEDAETISPTECRAIFDAVEAKRYFRTDIGQRRVGFIAQDVQAAAADPDFACLVGSTLVPGTGDSPASQELLTLDYARLTTVLWGVVKELSARVAELEASQAP